MVDFSTAGTPSISTSEKPTLRPATAEDVGRLKLALAEAFVDDPVFGWLMPDEDSRLARLRRFFDIELRHLVIPRGRTWTSPALAGAALSLPPGTWHAPPRVALLQAGCFGVRLHRAAGILALMEMRHIREPHYYFAYIGVAPHAQGQGLGTTLMSPTLERCDREGLPAYLEASSERNAALYERLGFKTTSELSFAGSPPLRLMSRLPSAQALAA
jgi:ribosomal protein S18 acetylase RimI-like enzyme